MLPLLLLVGLVQADPLGWLNGKLEKEVQSEYSHIRIRRDGNAAVADVRAGQRPGSDRDAAGPESAPSADAGIHAVHVRQLRRAAQAGAGADRRPRRRGDGALPGPLRSAGEGRRGGDRPGRGAGGAGVFRRKQPGEREHHHGRRLQVPGRVAGPLRRDLYGRLPQALGRYGHHGRSLEAQAGAVLPQPVADARSPTAWWSSTSTRTRARGKTCRRSPAPSRRPTCGGCRNRPAWWWRARWCRSGTRSRCSARRAREADARLRADISIAKMAGGLSR